MSHAQTQPSLRFGVSSGKSTHGGRRGCSCPRTFNKRVLSVEKQFSSVFWSRINKTCSFLFLPSLMLYDIPVIYVYTSREIYNISTQVNKLFTHIFTTAQQSPRTPTACLSPSCLSSQGSLAPPAPAGPCVLSGGDVAWLSSAPASSASGIPGPFAVRSARLQRRGLDWVACSSPLFQSAFLSPQMVQQRIPSRCKTSSRCSPSASPRGTSA